MPKVIGFVPARAGSKGVVGKNIKLLGGRPLINWTLDAAKSAGIFDDIVVSSDSDEILKVAQEQDVSVVKRPDVLSGDTVETIDVVLDYIRSSELSGADIVILLQPTCPFRKPSDIRQAVDFLKENKSPGVKSVVSVVDVGGTHPFRMKRIINGELVDYIDQGFEDMRPRQVLPKAYIRSGSIYAARVSDIEKTKSLVPRPTAPLLEDSSEAVNIDSYLDFYLAEALLHHG